MNTKIPDVYIFGYTSLYLGQNDLFYKLCNTKCNTNQILHPTKYVFEILVINKLRLSIVFDNRKPLALNLFLFFYNNAIIKSTRRITIFIGKLSLNNNSLAFFT